MSHWIINPNLWFVLGALMLAAGTFLGWMDVALILGIPAIIQSFTIAFFPEVMNRWEIVITTYILLTLLAFGLLIRFKNKIEGGDYDINDD